ncbi:hypothetical protein GQ42DRAFT_162527 [Ramicandelaber brevisporus]|nr:hypothetical protein GQ42DRAFT_162527 [Ramicandelaber brevisporus]
MKVFAVLVFAAVVAADATSFQACMGSCNNMWTACLANPANAVWCNTFFSSCLNVCMPHNV